ncbi:DUF2809 domain-containing protein [Leifsonia sp. NPDC058230]|uniref:ribosomal maturation YjgA family protein n=1 Tax=Leifsonia sp. NPDC058230 TaxID=3346391 RepID=UPI0036DDACCD
MSRRARAAIAAAGILVAGLLVHGLVGGFVGGFAGDALYAALIYTLIVVLAPRSRIVVVAIVATVFCAAIELLQLTPLPAALSRSVPGASLVVGSTFQWIDLVAYAVGIAIVAAVDAWVSGAAAGSSRGGSTTPSAGEPEPHPPAGTPSR